MKRKIVGWVGLVLLLGCGYWTTRIFISLICGHEVVMSLLVLVVGVASCMCLFGYASAGLMGGTPLAPTDLDDWQVVTIRAIYHSGTYTRLLVEMNPDCVYYLRTEQTDATEKLIVGYHYRRHKTEFVPLEIGKK